MNAPAKITPGPQVGAPPSLEQVPVDRLQVDPAYQRATDGIQSLNLIAAMVRQWDWRLCQPLVCARRADGSLWILDGQHRHAGAMARGDIAFLPCVIVPGIDIQTEAATFVALNTRRNKLTQGQIFHGMLAAGDLAAIATEAMIRETGWRVRQTSNTAIYKPGDLECAPMLSRVIANRRDDAAPRWVLTVMRAAWPTTPVRCAATLIKALIVAFDRFGADQQFTRAIITALGAADPDRWISRGAAIRDERQISTIAGVAEAIIAAVSGHSPVLTPRPAVRSPHRPAPAVPRAPGPFNEAGKGWCEQCEQLRTREAAAACTSRHCKLRPHT